MASTPSAETAAQNRKERLSKLKAAVKEYATAERKRLQNEADSLEAILNGRNGGKGIQKDGQQAVSKLAELDLHHYLAGEEI